MTAMIAMTAMIVMIVMIVETVMIKTNAHALGIIIMGMTA